MRSLLMLSALLVTSCASVKGITWDQPVFYAGPTVAPIEEVSSKNSTPAAAAGFAEKVGFFQYSMMNHEWDVFEIGALELGGLVPGGTGPAGMLQLGGSLSTLNGIIGFGLLFDCVDSAGNGACQGGHPGGPIYAGMFDVQAIVAYFSTTTTDSNGKMKLIEHMPRGGL
jgi:hypothetical protein